MVLVNTWGAFAVVAVISKRLILAEGWSREDAVFNIWILGLKLVSEPAPFVNHSRLLVTEALGIVGPKVLGTHAIHLIEVYEKLEVFFGCLVIVVRRSAIFLEEQCPLLVVEPLVEASIGAIPVETCLN